MTPEAIAPQTMNGRLRPHRVEALSERYPTRGSVKASVIRGIAPSKPTHAGFIPKPRFRMIIIPPLAVASRLFANAPDP